jgi:acyl-CoA synthetase (AMP-forming)/AMP-acid ligase II
MSKNEVSERLASLGLWVCGQPAKIKEILARPGGSLAVWAGGSGEDQAAILAVLLSCLRHDKKVYLSDSPDKLARMPRDQMFVGHALDHSWSNWCGPPSEGIVVLTSGTTESPKEVPLDWPTLFSSAANGSAFQERWMLNYSLTRFAGLQVLTHCLANGQQLVVPSDTRDYEKVLNDGVAAEANCMSCTPSWLRRFVMTVREKAKNLPLRQLTLGGEHSTQPILDMARSFWPSARTTHIYASTEAGTCFSVSDGLEGIPISCLDKGRRGRTGRLEEGQLVIQRNGADIHTGDMFDKVGDRILFRGRNSEIINVGGHKVSPVIVERVIEQVASVSAVRVYGKKHPLTGECVCADVVSDSANVEVEVLAACRSSLGKPEWPMLIRSVRSIETSGADKTIRRKEQ